MTATETLKEPSQLDQIEAALAKLPQAELPLIHLFTPGLYLRQIEIPAGTLLTSMEHLTEHPFFIIKGKIDVQSDFECIQYEAPCVGITKPGTRRILYAHEDTIWITIHANPDNLKKPEEIAERILGENANPLLEKDAKLIWKNSPEMTISSNPALETSNEERKN